MFTRRLVQCSTCTCTHGPVCPLLSNSVAKVGQGKVCRKLARMCLALSSACQSCFVLWTRVLLARQLCGQKTWFLHTTACPWHSLNAPVAAAIACVYDANIALGMLIYTQCAWT